MANIYNRLLHGTTDDLLDLLEFNSLDPTEMQAALTNTVKQLIVIRKEIELLKKEQIHGGR